jgi:hypothetical protein
MSKNKNKSIQSQQVVQIDGKSVQVTKLKPKKHRSKKHARHTITSCPNCLSTLKLNTFGVWYCTGDRLELWTGELEKYSRMNEQRKQDYLSSISEVDKFLDLFERWQYINERGIRENFNCGYSNEVYPPVSRVKSHLPDPAFVKSLERRMGRKLTEEEKANESELWEWNGVISDIKKKGAKRVRIPWINLPEDES